MSEALENEVEVEDAAVKRMRGKFEAKYGDVSDVMRSIQRWHNTLNDWNAAYNRDREVPVTEEDVELAEQEMLVAIRGYAGK